jgi:lipopolysaccharide transport system ATP-binding protein
MMTPFIRFDHVSKHYRLGLTRRSLPAWVSETVRSAVRRGSTTERENLLKALNDVCLEAGEGDSLALIGPNGAGKTTVLKLLARITKPTGGRVEVRGRLSALIELGAGFHPELTGRDNVFLNAAILGITRSDIQKRFDEIVDFAGLERFIDTPIKRYSSGMIVRLGFAVASCVDPQVLLVDEVLAVGDASFSQKCLARIRALSACGTILVFVSHNLYLVKAACTRALYLRDGSVRHAGATQDVIRAYEHDLHRERAARLAGAAPKEDEARVEITAVWVGRDGQGEPAPDGAPLSSEQPAEIRIAYNAYSDLGGVHVSVFLRRADGLVCCMARTSLDGMVLDVPEGTGTISLRLERLQLISGRYVAEAYFLDRSDSLVLTPNGSQSAWFTVSGRAISSAEDSGVFEPRSSWLHRAHGGVTLEQSEERKAYYA